MAVDPRQTERDIDILRKAVAAIKEVQKWTSEFGKANKTAGEAASKLFGVEKAKGEEFKKVRDNIRETAKQFKEYIAITKETEKGVEQARRLSEAQKKLAETQKRLREEARQARIEGGVFGRAGRALGIHSGGFREAARSGARNLLSRVGVDTFNPWALAAKAAMKVAEKAADATRGSLDLLIASGGKLTSANVLGHASQIAEAFAKNTMVALRWSASLEEVNAATLHFAERAGMSVTASQEFVARLAKTARMLGVDFSGAADFASESMTLLGRSSDDTLRILQQVEAVSKLTARETGHMGEKAGRTGGIFAKDLLKAVREVTKETGLFKHQNELLAVVLGNVYMGAVKLGAGYGTAQSMVRGFGRVLGTLGEYGEYVAGRPVRQMYTRDIPRLRKEINQLEEEARRRGGTLPAGQAARLRQLRRDLATAQLVQRAPLRGPGLALRAALATGGERGERGLKSAIHQIVRGIGVGPDMLVDLLNQAGIAPEQQGMMVKLLEQIDSGQIKVSELTAEQKKHLKTIADITSKRETPEQKVVGKLTESTDVMGKLTATLESLAGKVASMVLKLGELVAVMYRKWFPDERPGKPVEAGAAGGAVAKGTGVVDPRTLRAAKAVYQKVQDGKTKEGDLSARERELLKFYRSYLEGLQGGPITLPFDPPDVPVELPKAKRGRRGRRRRGRGDPRLPLKPPAPIGAQPQGPVFTLEDLNRLSETPEGGGTPVKKPGAFLTPGTGEPAVPTIVPTLPAREGGTTHAAAGGGGAAGGTRVAAAGGAGGAGGTLRGRGSIKPSEGQWQMTITIDNPEEALSFYEGQRAGQVAAGRVRST